VLAQEGDTLPIGSPIARVGDPADAAAPDATALPPIANTSPPIDTPAARDAGDSHPPTNPTEESPPPAPSAGVSVGGEDDRVKASPVARRLAKDQGIDLSAVEGSGPGGRIIQADVEKTAAGPASPPAPAAPSPAPTGETAKGQTTYEDLSKLQQVVARRMSESKATAPHFYLEAEIDMSAAVAARKRLKAMASDGEVVPSFNDMVVKACALALKGHPRANGAYRDGRFELYSRVNVGVAVAAQDALVVPTVFDADRKGLRQIAEDSRVVASKVRDGSITPPELSGGTFTVSNLGMYGIDNFSAVINTPQAAILAVGAIKERPVVRDGEITTAHLLGVTLACDHRILYGAPAAEFLARVRALLEEPLSLAL
jgi:pyruvate dehydrogenase E2 component (dihydrolipoamide acetyltransferase)